MVAFPQARHKDVAALDQTDLAVGLGAKAPVQNVRDPGAGGVDDHLRGDVAAARQGGGPGRAVAAGQEQFGAGGDLGAALMGVERVEHDQAGVVDPGVPIGAEPEAAGLQGRAEDIVASAEAPRAGQGAAPREQVVEQEPEADHPPGPAAGRIGQDELERADDVRRGGEQDLALVQRFADQLELDIVRDI